MTRFLLAMPAAWIKKYKYAITVSRYVLIGKANTRLHFVKFKSRQLLGCLFDKGSCRLRSSCALMSSMLFRWVLHGRRIRIVGIGLASTNKVQELITRLVNMYFIRIIFFYGNKGRFHPMLFLPRSKLGKIIAIN